MQVPGFVLVAHSKAAEHGKRYGRPIEDVLGDIRTTGQ